MVVAVKVVHVGHRDDEGCLPAYKGRKGAKGWSEVERGLSGEEGIQLCHSLKRMKMLGNQNDRTKMYLKSMKNNK